jgi:hypothetical protein
MYDGKILSRVFLVYVRGRSQCLSPEWKSNSFIVPVALTGMPFVELLRASGISTAFWIGLPRGASCVRSFEMVVSTVSVVLNISTPIHSRLLAVGGNNGSFVLL